MKRVFWKKKIGVVGICVITMTSILLGGCGSSSQYEGLDFDQYLKAGKYKGLEAEKIKVEITLQDIGNKIKADMDSQKKQVDVKKGEAVEDGDTVNIDYVGLIEGKKFDGGSAKNQSLQLGSGSFIEGFETGLVGHAVGEKDILLNLAFPLNYKTEKLQGKDVEFTVKINSATRNESPEYDKSFAKAMGYDSTEEYEAAVKENLRAEKKEEANKNQQSELWAQIMKSSKVLKYPEDAVENYVEIFNQQTDDMAEQYGTDRKDVMSQFGYATEKEYGKYMKQQAQEYVKQDMLVEYIAEKENLSYTDEEAEALTASIEEQGYDDDVMMSEMGKTVEQYVHTALLTQKVLNFVQKNAVIK